jgi:hypothetical protein
MSMDLNGCTDDPVRNLIQRVIFSHCSAFSASRR